MRNNSVNVWLMGTAICDLIMLSWIPYREIEEFSITNAEVDYECIPPGSFFKTYFDNYCNAIQSMTRRLYTWIGIIMATARVLIVSNPMNPSYDKLTKPYFAILSMLIPMIFCSLGPIMFLVPAVTSNDIQWKPDESCGYPKNFTMIKYGGAIDGWMFNYTMMAVVVAIEMILKIISVFSLPIVTIILIRLLRKAEASRKKLQRNSENSSNDHTTKLVTVMTISLLVSEGPGSIVTVILTMLEEDIFLLKIVTSIFSSWNLVVILNSAIHWLICVSMSSQYRNCVKEMFPCLAKRQNRRIEPSLDSGVRRSPSSSENNGSLFTRTQRY
ncbi:hypothetical protein CRE_18870 [Caenorhabditis remanei]|uniref:G-protein coupled receptors family 1 profile domain-containing protein n=1 Tax=Caenorhabditis remanei TaxID=31234 RepID=E3LL95_CAERE|nr:hypothetical protein CRE_18870 [Caenorhabditis remanei]